MTIIYIVSIIVLVIADLFAPIFIVKSPKTKFTKQSLQNGEEIQAVAKTHWIVMLNIIIVMAIISALCVMMLVFGTEEISEGGVIVIICVFAILFWLLASLRKQILCWCREFVVTNKRILLKVGIFARETKEFRFEKIESCDINQSVFGRLLSYGSIVIRGVGGSGNIEFYINNPFEFRQYIIDRISVWKDSSAVERQSMQQYDSISELQAYKKLFDDNVITKEEFEKKKQEILKRT